ncbi:glycerate dehydrogenase [Halobacillus andaensis]|uniref:Glycerate dehydrogenase n=1 Tax=Halobacillus andaensis TaxID=1176239 RepID=A0A917EVZ9_HALAA|nr:D-2-hydroxyacid dehydrogenase [Halobacillus andaensis]MBP2006177.1 phosphoglycerate dehydrogenase-like enzyme [Halobacillus andaensis]GGF23086.1 glycerate dehydrogenase [Halobacillus andaensis]
MLILSAIKRVPDDIREHFEQTFGEVEFLFCHGIEEAEEHLPKADVFVTYGEDLNKERIRAAKQLKWIMVLSAGMDRMPFNEIDKQDILVTNVRGIHAKPMAEYALSMILQVARNAKMLTQRERDHKWDRRVPMKEINNRTMVLLGTGAIAQETARLARAFQMKTIGVSRSGKSTECFDETYKVEEMDQALEAADYLVAVLPSTSGTRYLLKREHFTKMPSHSVFLNMGRGDLVKSEDILDAVRSGDVAHAVLDVFEEEPLPEDHVFWDEENITITPHLSGISPHYVPRGFDLFERNLKAYLKDDKLENVIDPKRGY